MGLLNRYYQRYVKSWHQDLTWLQIDNTGNEDQDWEEIRLWFPEVDDIEEIHEEMLRIGEKGSPGYIGGDDVGRGKLEFLQDMIINYNYYPTLADKAFFIIQQIVSNHIFADANKRTGFFTAVAFLDFNSTYIDREVLKNAIGDFVEGSLNKEEFNELLNSEFQQLQHEEEIEPTESFDEYLQEYNSGEGRSMQAKDKKWEESKHPRDEKGRFKPKAVGKKTRKKRMEELRNDKQIKKIIKELSDK